MDLKVPSSLNLLRIFNIDYSYNLLFVNCNEKLSRTEELKKRRVIPIRSHFASIIFLIFTNKYMHKLFFLEKRTDFLRKRHHFLLRLLYKEIKERVLRIITRRNIRRARAKFLWNLYFIMPNLLSLRGSLWSWLFRVLPNSVPSAKKKGL